MLPGEDEPTPRQALLTCGAALVALLLAVAALVLVVVFGARIHPAAR